MLVISRTYSLHLENYEIFRKTNGSMKRETNISVPIVVITMEINVCNFDITIFVATVLIINDA